MSACWRGSANRPKLLVPDNLKSGVHKASFYDPEINLTYGRMAEHYGIGILPARPYRPRDKAKVEAGVRIAQIYILGRLRHQTFFSLTEGNQAIRGAVERINDHVMRRLGREPPGSVLSDSTSRRCGPCRRPLTNTPNGRRPGSTSTIMSKLRGLLLLGAARTDR